MISFRLAWHNSPDHCREDNRFVAKNGKRKAFHVGGNSSCRQHIHGHYELYCE
ncbi:hypothetical protein BU15DRAFT_57513 [Melanogaster broomeanus]|nr:hypothetical protein BU15DRAFT_57513 [Melanogaster broomeanus]